MLNLVMVFIKVFYLTYTIRIIFAGSIVEQIHQGSFSTFNNVILCWNKKVS